MIAEIAAHLSYSVFKHLRNALRAASSIDSSLHPLEQTSVLLRYIFQALTRRERTPLLTSHLAARDYLVVNAR